MKIKELIKRLEVYAPSNQENIDEKIGLVLGEKDKEISNVLVTLTVNDEVVSKAIDMNSNFIISCNSFEIHRITADTYHGQLIERMIKNDISLYIMDSNLDNSRYGFYQLIAEMIGLSNIEINKITYKEKCYKLVSCIPVEKENWTEKIRRALGEIGVNDGRNGAGYVGDYSEVSDYSLCYQWFRTMPGASPHIGSIGELSKVKSERFEMIIPEHQLDECIEKLIEIHPYEEVEYDVYPIMETRNHAGIGRTGSMPVKITKKHLIKKLEESLRFDLLITDKKAVTEIKKITICEEVDDNTIDKIINNNIEAVIASKIDFKKASILKDLGRTVIIIDEFSLKMIAVKNLESYLKSIGVLSEVYEDKVLETYEKNKDKKLKAEEKII